MKKYIPLLVALALSTPAFANDPAETPKPAAPDQTFREATPQQAQAFIAANADVQIADVRTPEEFAEGHIKGAQCVNVLGDTFDTDIAKLDRKKPLLIHCRSGGRSRNALARMKGMGFTEVVHLTDGFNGWKAAKLPVEK